MVILIDNSRFKWFIITEIKALTNEKIDALGEVLVVEGDHLPVVDL